MSGRIEFVGGGVPSVEEIAAVVLALTPVPVVGADDQGDGAPGAGTSAWARAGLREGVGGRPAAAPGDLAALR